jgi:hypothetical protein
MISSVENKAGMTTSSCDFLASDGWKGESGGPILHHGGRGWSERQKELASTTKPYSPSEPYATLQPEKALR